MRRKQLRFACAELFTDQREAQDAALKPVRKARKQRGFLLVFEEIELAHDEVAFLASLNQFFEAWIMPPQAAVRFRGLWIHAGDKQCIIADMFAQCTLGIEG